MTRIWMVAAALLMAAGLAEAGAPWVAPRPVLRAPVLAREMPARPVHRRVTLVSVTYGAPYRPPLRPAWLVRGSGGGEEPVAAITPAAGRVATPAPVRAAAVTPGAFPVALAGARGIERAPRPVLRPFASAPRVAEPRVATATPSTRTGAVCGVGDIRGQELAPIRGRMRGCSVDRPVRVTSIGGVRLSQPAVIDCTTARALRSWIDRGVKPAVGRLGGGVRGLRVAASYSCRTRNSRPGAKLSEHAKGHAIDISGIELANGKTITVLDGWGRRAEGKVLRRVHKAACGPFGTVLGPGSDRYHKDHLHLDTARYRGGPYCR